VVDLQLNDGFVSFPLKMALFFLKIVYVIVKGLSILLSGKCFYDGRRGRRPRYKKAAADRRSAETDRAHGKRSVLVTFVRVGGGVFPSRSQRH